MHRWRLTFGMGVLLAANPASAADEGLPIAPIQAKQCAVWAAYMADTYAEDAEASQAFTQTSTYFVGVYEGATGHSIARDVDQEAVLAVERDLPGLSTTCSALMTSFGGRMIEWGEVLNQISHAAPQVK